MSVSGCNVEVSNSLSRMPPELLNNSYLSTITTVTFPSSISSLPSYLCSLPSKEINLSDQAFTTLDDSTFPCLDSFTKVTLARNRITSVNMASGNFQTLTSLDLSANSLTQVPYSILRPTPSSLRILDLRNNSLTSIDLFLYTLQNITVYLDNNPIDGSVINPQNVSLNSNTTSTTNISLPPGSNNDIRVANDAYVASLFSCSIFESVQALRVSSLGQSIRIDCTCASFGLKELYQNNGLTITAYWNCSNSADRATFISLTTATCPGATNFTTQTCPLVCL